MKAGILFLLPFLLGAQVAPVLTRGVDNTRSGVNHGETILNARTVSGLRVLYSIQIPGDKRGIESQPLVATGIKGSDGITRDLIILSTMANDVLACDLKDGKTIWKINLGHPIDSTKAIDFWQLADHMGILSTGVIDPDTSTWYGVTWSSPDGTASKGWHSLHAVDLKAGKESSAPLSMNPLSYDPGHGLPVSKFAGQMRKQRSALTLATIGGRKTIFVVSGSVLETNGSASGWVAAADLGAWRFTGSWASTSNGWGAGIWMAGSGLSVDSKGYLYALTGNGSFDGITDFAESFIKLQYTPPTDPQHSMGTIRCISWWSPYSDAGRTGKNPTQSMPTTGPKLAGINNASKDGYLIEPVEADTLHHLQMMPAPKSDPRWLAWGDQDLGSAGIALIEKYDAIIGSGKDGIAYSVNMSNLGNTLPPDFGNPAANYAKLLAPPAWFTYAAFKHDSRGQVIGYEEAAPKDVTKLNFAYDNLTHHSHSTMTTFESEKYGTTVECFGENGNLRMWQVQPNGGLKFLGNGQETASYVSHGMPGGMMAISSHGKQDGLLWAIIPAGDANRSITDGKLIAYDLSNLDRYPDGSGWIKTVWSSTFQFREPKFNVPVVTGGKVILPSYDGRVLVLGL